MKKSILIVAFFGFLFTACEKKSNAIETTDATEVNAVEDAVQYASLDTTVSAVTWEGSKFWEDASKEGEGHNGSISFKTVALGAKEGGVTTGSFVVDMNTLESKDLNEDPQLKGKLDGHLKAEDFFGVEAFPESSFNITEVVALEEGDYNTEISGNMKIRDQEKNITFKANVEVTEEAISVDSEKFTINREDFDVKYSGSIKNGFISKDINIKVTAKVAL